MDVVTSVLRWFAENVFQEVAILIGLITMVGLILQRKPVEDVVAGALRATVGVIILFIGIDVFVGGLIAFQTIVASAVGLEPPQAAQSLGDFLGQQGGTIALVIRRVIGSDDWGYGHTSSAACYIAGQGGRLLGSKEEHDTEKLRITARLSFFKDINVSTAVVIGAILLVAMIFADRALVGEQAAGYAANPEINPWVWGIVQALRFAGGIAILLFGVRMFLAEIVPAFKGISDRVIPGSRPALDVPTIFPFAPTAVMIGFLSSTAVFLVLMGVFAAAGWFVLVPPMIMLFFPGGGAGVFGNAFGGWRGAGLGGGVHGIFLAVGQALTGGVLSETPPG